MPARQVDRVCVLYLENGQTLKDALPITAIPVDSFDEKDPLSTEPWSLVLRVLDPHYEDSGGKYFSSRRRFSAIDVHPEAKPDVKIQLVCGGDFAFGVNTNKVAVGDNLVVVRPKVRSFEFEGMVKEAFIGFGYRPDWQIIIYREKKVASIPSISFSTSPRKVMDSGIKYTEIPKCRNSVDKYNTWGIIRRVDCYPRETSGSDLMSRIYIQDEHSIETGTFSDFQVNIFDPQALNFPPMLVGDVINVRHMKIQLFNNVRTGTIYRGKACSVFKGDFFGRIERRGDNCEPISDFDFLMVTKLRAWWRLHISKVEFLNSIERPLNEINGASFAMVACKMVKFLEVRDDNEEFKKVLRVVDGTTPIVPFILHSDGKDPQELTPTEKWVDIFIGQTKDFPIDQMFKEGNFAIVFVKCVKISIDDHSSAYRLVFAGHSNNHFRLLQENDPLSNKIKERLQLSSTSQTDFPYSEDFNKIAQSFDTQMVLMNQDSQLNQDEENVVIQNSPIKSASKRKLSSKDTITSAKVPKAAKQSETIDPNETSNIGTLNETSSQQKSSGIDSTPVVQTYESNNEQLEIQMAPMVETNASPSSSQDSFYSVLETQTWANSQSSHQAKGLDRIQEEEVLETRASQCFSSQKVKSPKSSPAKSKKLSSAIKNSPKKDRKAKTVVPDRSDEHESSQVELENVTNQTNESNRDSDDSEDSSVVKLVRVLDLFPVSSEVRFECRIISTTVRPDRVWNFIWLKCCDCGILKKGRKPPHRQCVNMCGVCRGRMDPILHMTSEVRDDEGEVTTLEWSNEACERLVECNAMELIENPDVQWRASAILESLTTHRVRVIVSVNSSRRRKYVVVLK